MVHLSSEESVMAWQYLFSQWHGLQLLRDIEEIMSLSMVMNFYSVGNAKFDCILPITSIFLDWDC